MDETGQFFRALPNKSLSQASGNCTGGKRSKERLTCAFFVNASGDKEKPIIIGKSANPRCFRGVSDRATLPCEYFSQPKAWMESDILTEILRKMNARLRREKRTIVLLMDNEPCHPEDLNDKFSQIKIVFLPKNTTSRLQPLDLGIIQTFKLKYYKRLLTHVVNKVDDCSTASEVCKSVDVLQAIRWTAMAWNDVPKSTVVKCFIKAEVLNCEGETNAAEAADSDFDPFAELDSDINIVEDLAKETSGTNVVSIKETVNGCFDPPICQELPDNWEDSFFRQLRQGNVDVANNDNDDGNLDDEVQELPAVPKLASYREAISCLEDVLHFLESKGNADTADSLSKVISNAQRDWLQRRTSQTKVSDFFSKS